MLILSGMKYSVQTYRSCGSQEEILSLPAGVQAKLIRQLDKLRNNPTVLREPDSKPLPNGLFEIRTVGLIHTVGSTFISGKNHFSAAGVYQEDAKNALC